MDGGAAAGVVQGSPRYEAFASRVVQILKGTGDDDGVEVEDVILPQVNDAAAGGNPYSTEEADAILRIMEAESQVMYESGLVYLI